MRPVPLINPKSSPRPSKIKAIANDKIASPGVKAASTPEMARTIPEADCHDRAVP